MSLKQLDHHVKIKVIGVMLKYLHSSNAKNKNTLISSDWSTCIHKCFQQHKNGKGLLKNYKTSSNQECAHLTNGMGWTPTSRKFPIITHGLATTPHSRTWLSTNVVNTTFQDNSIESFMMWVTPRRMNNKHTFAFARHSC
jgi:hypothetical protein